MTPLRRFGTYLLLSTLGYLSQQAPAFPQAASTTAATAPQQPRDGQHDFDFHFGTWHTHLRHLEHPLSCSTTLTERDCTVTVHKVWDVRANLEELEAGNTSTH